MAELHELDALAQAAAVRSGEVSPVELVEHHLDRIAALDARLGAFVTVTAQAAREQAREAERHAREDDLPPLYGVPTAIKDNVGTAGVRTTFGSQVFADFVPQVDAHVVTRLRQAGTISLGKLNLAEFGLAAYSDTTVGGSARTPWDLSRSAGGSSGGSGAAVAAGLVPIAHGNDAAGSIRIPASVCGLFGLKPSRGRISNGPLGMDPFGMVCQGPLARTVRDAAAMLDAMAGPMAGDDHWAAPLPQGETFLGWAGREPGRLRVARYHDVGFPVDPACLAAYEAATELLTRLGHEVEEIDCPFPLGGVDLFVALWGVRSLRIQAGEAEELLRPATRWWRERGRETSSERFLNALMDLRLIAAQTLVTTDSYDVVLTPSLAMLPQRPEWFTAPADRAEEMRRQNSFSPYTALANVTGQPSASLPLHWTPDGLPVGVMLTGRPADDARLLSLCAQLESARPWAHHRPPSIP